MPEGDTIFRSAARLHEALAGQIVTGFRTVFPHLSRIDDGAPLAGRAVERVRPVGKHILMHFSNDLILRTHMRMHGSWHLYRPGERWQAPAGDMRIVVRTAVFDAVAFRVPVAEFRTAAQLARDAAVNGLGPDLLATDFDPRMAIDRLRALGDMAIADALLVQRAVAGIGNVFKSEVLFEAGVSPFAPVTSLNDEAMLRLMDVARHQLAVNAGSADGAAWPGLRRTTGRLNPEERLWVYGRAGRACRRCGTRVEMVKQGTDARVTYYCPTCQGASA